MIYDVNSLPPRIVRKIDASGDCWLWTGSRCPRGYGYAWIGGKARRAHRAFYELLVGPIPEGLVIDHLCRVTSCVNPAHLEPVTNRENVLRGESPTATAVRTNQCKHGHEFTPENTLIYMGRRNCRACRRLTRQRFDARRAALKRKAKEAAGDC